MDQNNERVQLLERALNILESFGALLGALPETDIDADLPNETVNVMAPFICRHCRDYVRGGVITICGHLFCWTCLWPLLVENQSPECPQCQTALILHEDIIPFYGEGPNAGAADNELLAYPGAVPRPSGIRFTVPNAQIVDRFVAERDQRLQRKLSFPRIKLTLTYLKWLQVICVILMLLVWRFILMN